MSSHCLVHPEDCQSSQHPDEIANHVKEDEISDDAKEDEILASGCSQVPRTTFTPSVYVTTALLLFLGLIFVAVKYPLQIGASTNKNESTAELPPIETLTPSTARPKVALVQEDRHPKEVDESVTVTAVQHGLQKLALSDGTVSRQRMAKDGLPSPSSTGAAEQQGAGSTFVQEVETGVEGGVVPALESLQDLRISDSGTALGFIWCVTHTYRALSRAPLSQQLKWSSSLSVLGARADKFFS